jgi:hypothetical protein
MIPGTTAHLFLKGAASQKARIRIVVPVPVNMG